MFKKVIIPLDGSRLAEEALGRGAAIARAANAAVDLVLVQVPSPLGDWHGASHEQADRDAAHRYLETIARELSTGSGLQVTHCLRKGDAVHHICDRAMAIQADLIVMTSHGRTGFSRAWFGSVADGVMRHSTTPVLVLRPREVQRGPEAAEQLFKHVLVPVDGSSTEIIPAAVALAKCANARMTLLRIIQPIPQVFLEAGVPHTAMVAIVDDPATKALSETVKQQLVEAARRVHDETGLDVEAEVIVDLPVATAIIDFARGANVDVIAMATHSGAVSRVVLGSVADKVTRGADLPVLLYRPAASNSEKWTSPVSAQTAMTMA
jgi:nucleotide-binding universal stress UspA family protein